MDINQYLINLVPKNTADINTTELQIKLINFYSKLKYANQMISEGKVACSIPITWDCELKDNINSINCYLANIMLKLISSDFIYIGKYIRYAVTFRQANKFKFQQNRNGLITNDPNKIKKPN